MAGLVIAALLMPATGCRMEAANPFSLGKSAEPTETTQTSTGDAIPPASELGLEAE